MKCISLIVVVATALLSGCASTVIEQRTFKSYTVGRDLTATTGSVMFTDQNGYITKRRVWVGILNSPDGWKTTTEPSEDFYKKELIYSGLSGTTVELNYREFRQGYAAPAFYQSVKYDLAESKTVQFQNFTIDIIAADNRQIRYKIVRDR